MAGNEYTISVDPKVESVGFPLHRAVVATLAGSGYSAKLRAFGQGSWMYRSEEPLDDETMQKINDLPGVKIKKFEIIK